MTKCSSPENLYGKFGLLVGTYPIPFLIAPIVITIGLLITLAVRPEGKSQVPDEFSLFLPDGSDWFTEKEMEKAYMSVHPKKNSSGNCTAHSHSTGRFKRSTDDSQTVATVSDALAIDILGRRKDFGSVLNASVSDEFLRFSRFLYNNFTFVSGGRRVRLTNICRKYRCITPTLRMMNVFLGSFYFTDSGNTSDIQFEFPMVTIKRWDEIFPVFWLIANVTTDASGKILDAFLLRNTISIILDKVTMTERNQVRDQLEDFSNAFELGFLNNQTFVDTFPLELFLFTSASEELSTTNVSIVAIPLLGVSLVLLTLFTVFSSIRLSGTTSKPWEALAGVVNPSMAIATTISLLFLADYTWFSMLSAMTYLVLSIGVDDMFILLECWHESDKLLPPAERLAWVMSQAGRSVLLTSIINVASFAAGLTQNIPAVRQFSIFTAVGLAVEFSYQMTFFLAVLVIGGRRESQRRNAILCCLHNDTADDFCCGLSTTAADSNRSSCLQRFSPATTVAKNNCDGPVKIGSQQSKWKVPLFRASVTEPIILTIFIAYLVWATISCTTLVTNLSPKKLVMRTSALHRFLEVEEVTLAKEVKMATVYVLRPPNFNNRTEWNSFNQLVRDLENIGNFSSGSHATILWLNSYQDFLDGIGWTDFYEPLEDWMGTDLASDMKFQLQLGNRAACEPPILAFQFSTFYQHFHDYSDLITVVDVWREIYSRYEQFNVTITTEESQLADAVRSLADNVMQDCGVAFVCVWLATMLVLLGETDRLAVFWVSYLLLVVEAGVVGLLKSWAQAELDSITMITITMSVGFSVDYLLHAAHSVRSSGGVRGVVRPFIQASIATMLGVVGLVLVDVYALQVFFHTIAISVLLGFLHGLFVLPMMLTRT